MECLIYKRDNIKKKIFNKFISKNCQLDYIKFIEQSKCQKMSVLYKNK